MKIMFMDAWLEGQAIIIFLKWGELIVRFLVQIVKVSHEKKYSCNMDII